MHCDGMKSTRILEAEFIIKVLEIRKDISWNGYTDRGLAGYEVNDGKNGRRMMVEM